MNDSISLSKKIAGKIEIKSKIKLTKKNLPLLYTPGVAEISSAIAKDKKLSFDYTIRNNTVAIVSDGSAVLGLGNIGPEAALPVMEGKALLFKELGGIDAFPIVLKTQKTDEIVNIIQNISASFGGINLEDISAPRCFEIEQKLKLSLEIPVFHDDQHGTAIVVLAGLINSLKLTERKVVETKIVISGAGAAGIAIANLLLKYGFENTLLVDTKGILHEGRTTRMNSEKRKIAALTNKSKVRGSLRDALRNADVFIGVSAPNIIEAADVMTMAENPIVFAMSNPNPEIFPNQARAGGAVIVATGRSDFPNQINNALVFPGIFKGAFAHRSRIITDHHMLLAAKSIASMVSDPSTNNIVPNVLNKKVPTIVSNIFK